MVEVDVKHALILRQLASGSQQGCPTCEARVTRPGGVVLDGLLPPWFCVCECVDEVLEHALLTVVERVFDAHATTAIVAFVAKSRPCNSIATAPRFCNNN